MSIRNWSLKEGQTRRGDGTRETKGKRRQTKGTQRRVCAGRVMILSRSLHHLLRHKKYNQDIKYLHNNPFLILSIYFQIKPSNNIISQLISNVMRAFLNGETLEVIRSMNRL